MPFAKTLNFQGHQPVVKGVRQTYHCGVKLSQKAMNVLEKQCQRLPGLETRLGKLRAEKNRSPDL